MRYKLILLLIIALLSHINVYSQSSISDSSINFSVIGMNYTFYIPGGDLKDRFGTHSGLGISYDFKAKSNFIFGAKYNFIIGTNVKENDIIDGIISSEGYLINTQGYLQPVALDQRGFSLTGYTGKIFPVFGPNPNSGIFIKLGAGFLQHFIYFDYAENTVSVPQIEQEYRKGYDRLTNGLLLNQSIGYYYFHNDNFGSFHISLDFNQAFTQNRRSWNFDEFRHDDTKRLDLMYGINIGLDIPIYNRVPDNYYIY